MERRRILLAGALVLVAAITVATAGLVLTRSATPAVRGDLIAYSCRERPKDEWFAVCVIHADGTGQRKLTSRLPTSDPGWSPDGRQIVFTRHVDPGQYSSFTQDDLFVMDADGDAPRRLTRTRYGNSIGEATWSPDGNRIAFVRGSGVPLAGLNFGAIFAINTDGSDVLRITRGPRDTDPSWSPNGREIAFARASAFTSATDADIYVVSTNGGKSRRLTRVTPDVASGPAWSPDGTKIAFVRATLLTPSDGKSAIYVMNADGSGLRLIATNRHFSRYPGNLAWSPDSTTIAFVTSPSFDCTSIQLLDLRSSERRPLTSCAGAASSADSPSWQPAAD